MSGNKVPTADDIIKKLGLEPLPEEGGYFRETYRNDSPGVPARHFGIPSDSVRRISTAIYYVVTPRSFSALHRIRSDEVFHFYAGDPVEMIQISDKGVLRKLVIGPDVMNGQVPQVVVPREHWQGLRLREGGQWALLGTTVAPGFEFEDFETVEREQMVISFPELRESITKFTRAPGEKAHE